MRWVTAESAARSGVDVVATAAFGCRISVVWAGSGGSFTMIKIDCVRHVVLLVHVDICVNCIYRHRMPQKKTKKPKAARKTVTLRFDAAELEAIDADRKDITNGSIPVGLGAYCKHAVENFRSMRKLMSVIRDCSANQHSPAREWARNALSLAGSP